MQSVKQIKIIIIPKQISKLLQCKTSEKKKKILFYSFTKTYLVNTDLQITFDTESNPTLILMEVPNNYFASLLTNESAGDVLLMLICMRKSPAFKSLNFSFHHFI